MFHTCGKNFCFAVIFNFSVNFAEQNMASDFPYPFKPFQWQKWKLSLHYQVGRDRGAGDREKRGWEVYGRREKRGREAGFPRWREAGEEGTSYATLRNISQSKKCKGAGAKKYRAETGIKGYGKREVQTPCPPYQYLLKRWEKRKWLIMRRCLDI